MVVSIKFESAWLPLQGLVSLITSNSNLLHQIAVFQKNNVIFLTNLGGGYYLIYWFKLASSRKAIKYLIEEH